MGDRSRRFVLTPAPERPHLDELLARARAIEVTDEMLREQRDNYVRAYMASVRARKPLDNR